MKKLMSFVLVLTIIVSMLVAGTYAKYTNTVSGSSTATVAKWIVKAGEKGNEVQLTGDSSTVTFDLFKTILDDDGTTAEGKVAAGKIAPGTSGKFTFSVVNESEVDVTYTMKFTAGDTTIPLQFRVDEGDWGELAGDVATNKELKQGKSTDVTVYWKWPYEAENGNTNTADTALGVVGDDVTVTAALTIVQAD